MRRALVAAALVSAVAAGGACPLAARINASAKRTKVKPYGGWNVDRKGAGDGRRSR